MNVCLANDSFPPLIDGVATTVLNYAKIITEKYGKATVLVPKYPDVVDDYPFDVVRYPSIDTTKMVGYRTGLSFSNVILEKTENKGIDIIHSHCPAASTVTARYVREAIDAPLVLTYHTKFDIDIARVLKTKPLQELAVKIFVANISACDEVWTVSNGAAENLKKLGYTGDCIIMKNGVDFPKERVPEEAVDVLAEQYSINRTNPVFLFVGRMMWYKGCRLTLDSLAKAKADGYGFTMIFVGNGDDKEEIEEYAKQIGLAENCIFTGAVHDRTLLRTFFCLADMFLFPSTFDTNGIVVREAAACSLASMMIRGSCAAEDIEDGRNGILIDENVESMSFAIEAVCNNRLKAKEIGNNAASDIYMSWDGAVAAAIDRYGTVIENYKSKPKKRVIDNEFLAVLTRNYDSLQEFKREYEKLGKSIKDFIESEENIDRYL